MQLCGACLQAMICSTDKKYDRAPHESPEPQETAADQMDGGQTRGQTKTLFNQPSDSTPAANLAHRVGGN